MSSIESDIAIRVESLSKKYTIGSHKSDSFRDTLSQVFTKRESSSERDFWALKDVSFEIKKGEAVGIIGKNGAGKSTLLKVLSRITEPTTGKITLNGRVSSLLEVGTGFHPELTGKENIYLNGTILGMSRREVKDKFDEIVAFSGVEKFLNTPVKHYSSGMYVRLAFAVAAHLEPEILIIDEVLAVGDAEFQKKCLGKMEDVASQGRTVIFVSHNLNALSTLCSSGVLIQKGNAKHFTSISSAITEYNRIKLKNKLVFDSGIVRSIELLPTQETLTLIVEYKSDFEIDIPNFGFVISDTYGLPITGTNLLRYHPKLPLVNQKTGKVEVKISSPKLSRGIYSLSVWFGDISRNYFKSENCLNFTVDDMKKINLHSTKIEGCIIPECDWTLS